MNGDFEVVPGNGCPLVHSISVFPLQDAAGAELEIVATDPAGSELSYAWTADAGSFDDSGSGNPLYFCGVETGLQAISVLVSNGMTSCDAQTEVEVDCGVDATPAELSADIQCNPALAIGMHEIEVHMTVDTPVGVPGDPQAQDAVVRDPRVLFREMFGEGLWGLGTDLVQLESLAIEVVVAGGTPATFTIEAGPYSFDIDQNDDGTVEEVWLALPSADLVVSSDGSPSMDFSIVEVRAESSEVPVVGTMSIIAPQPNDPNVQGCTLLTGAVSFSVN